MRQNVSVETLGLTPGGWLCAGALRLSRPRSASDPAPSQPQNRFIQREIPTKGLHGEEKLGGHTRGPSLLCLWQGPHPSMTTAPVPHSLALSALGRGWSGWLLAVAHPHHTFLGLLAAHAPNSGPLLQRLHCSHLTESCPALCLSPAQLSRCVRFLGSRCRRRDHF